MCSVEHLSIFSQRQNEPDLPPLDGTVGV